MHTTNKHHSRKGIGRKLVLWAFICLFTAIASAVLISMGMTSHPELVGFGATTFVVSGLFIAILTVALSTVDSMRLRSKYPDLWAEANRRDMSSTERLPARRRLHAVCDTFRARVAKIGLMLGLLCLGLWLVGILTVGIGALYFKVPVFVKILTGFK